MQGAGEGGGSRPKPVRICEANTQILRANYQLNLDAMFIESQPAMRRINGSLPHRGESNSVQGADVRKRRGSAEWDALSQWRPRRKARPGIRIQTGT